MKYILASVTFLALTPIASALTLEMVPVGNPGNAPDTRYSSYGVGAVSYGYQIGKYEITAGQYAEFLNAVAKADPNNLYSEYMLSTGLYGGAGIVRTGSSPNFLYSVADDRVNRPVNFVSLWDAARFCNWLHNGQPVGAQGFGTTESGAYHDIGDPSLFGRTPGAKYFLPSSDEWYKSAYHNRSSELAADYFDYPTGTNAVPANDTTERLRPGNNANFVGRMVVEPFFGRTNIGEFELSDSPYGTFDQGGNVAEWVDSHPRFFGVNSLYLGGGWQSQVVDLSAASFGQKIDNQWDEYADLGFRVASIPEPSAFALAAVACVGFCLRRRKSVAQNCA